MHSQLTDTLLMVRPVAFQKNEETAENNFYQQTITGVSKTALQEKALTEFDGLVQKLKDKNIKVIVINDIIKPATPDSIFPNNWISFHSDGSIMLFPMFAENRRLERREDILELLKEDFLISQIDSLADWEQKEIYLEGTGALILDRVNKIAYAAVSDRTNPELIKVFCKQKGFDPIIFYAYQSVGSDRLLIYHTNVMMCIGERFALICADSIDDNSEREMVLSSLRDSEKDVIEISEAQNNCFAGNMLQVMNQNNERFIVMSEAAYNSLDKHQITRLETHGEIIHSNIDTIETLGGGSARCMIAEVFLPKK